MPLRPKSTAKTKGFGISHAGHSSGRAYRMCVVFQAFPKLSKMPQLIEVCSAGAMKISETGDQQVTQLTLIDHFCQGPSTTLLVLAIGQPGTKLYGLASNLTPLKPYSDSRSRKQFLQQSLPIFLASAGLQALLVRL